MIKIPCSCINCIQTTTETNFIPILSELQQQKLEKICQNVSSWAKSWSHVSELAQDPRVSPVNYRGIMMLFLDTWNDFHWYHFFHSFVCSTNHSISFSTLLNRSTSNQPFLRLRPELGSSFGEGWRGGWGEARGPGEETLRRDWGEGQ